MRDTVAVLGEIGDEPMSEAASRLAAAVRDRRSGGASDEGNGGILGLLRATQAPAQREALDRLLVLGTLLEGHADHVMDAVGPEVVPSVVTIRSAFEHRRNAFGEPAAAARPRPARDRRQDGPVRARQEVRRRGRRPGREAEFNTIWTGPDRCRCRPRSMNRADGSRGCSAERAAARAPAGDNCGADRAACGPGVGADHDPGEAPQVVAVALSGGADSTALTAGALAEGAVVHALVVDHGLQPGSARVAAQAAASAIRLGAASARVLTVTVGSDGGMEAAARTARYAALRDATQRWPVLLGHTLDDQAETVLLGLGRGSGGRSIHGMRAWNPPWGRPLLGVRRATTRQMCADLGVETYDDPHNAAPEFTRVRLREEVLPLLENVLGGGVVAALGRTAATSCATTVTSSTISPPTCSCGPASPAVSTGARPVDLDAAILATAPPRAESPCGPVVAARGPAQTLSTATQLYAIDELVARWRGQGGVAVGGGSPDVRLVASRRRGRLSVDANLSGLNLFGDELDWR